jgi:hypothetical protein
MTVKQQHLSGNPKIPTLQPGDIECQWFSGKNLTKPERDYFNASSLKSGHHKPVGITVERDESHAQMAAGLLAYLQANGLEAHYGAMIDAIGAPAGALAWRRRRMGSRTKRQARLPGRLFDLCCVSPLFDNLLHLGNELRCRFPPDWRWLGKSATISVITKKLAFLGCSHLNCAFNLPWMSMRL